MLGRLLGRLLGLGRLFRLSGLLGLGRLRGFGGLFRFGRLRGFGGLFGLDGLPELSGLVRQLNLNRRVGRHRCVGIEGLFGARAVSALKVLEDEIAELDRARSRRLSLLGIKSEREGSILRNHGIRARVTRDFGIIAPSAGSLVLAVRLAGGDRHVSQRALAVGQGHFYARRDSIIIPSAANDCERHGDSVSLIGNVQSTFLISDLIVALKFLTTRSNVVSPCGSCACARSCGDGIFNKALRFFTIYHSTYARGVFLRKGIANLKVDIARRNSHGSRGNFEGIAARNVLVASKRGFGFYRDFTDILDGRHIGAPSYPIIDTILNLSTRNVRLRSASVIVAIVRVTIVCTGDGQCRVIGRNFQRTGLVGDGIVFCQRVVFQRMARNRIRAGTNFRLAALYVHARKAFFAYEAAITDRVAVSRQRSAVILLGIRVRRQFDRNGRDRQRTFNRGDVVVVSLRIAVRRIGKRIVTGLRVADIRCRAGEVIRRALAINKTIAGNGDLMLGQGIAVVNLLVAGGGQGHIAFGDLNGVLGRFCLIAFLLSRDLDPKFTDVFKLRHTIIICVCAVLSILGLVGQRCTFGICHCAAMRAAVILAGIVRSGKRQLIGRDLACGDGEVNRTALDCQCGLAVQGHVAVLISLSGLGIDGDGVGLLPSIDGLFNTAFCFCILHSFISIEFPLANEAVISRHTGGQAVGHSTAVQTADDILRDRRKSAHQAVSVAGIVGVSLVARLLGGDLVFQIVADRNFRVYRTPPKTCASLIIVIRNLLSACTKADGVNRCALL